MRRILTVLAVAFALSAVAVPAYADSGHHGHRHAGPHAESAGVVSLVVMRRASAIGQYAPGIDPEPTFPFVTVRATVRGCEPGRLYLVHATFHQRRHEIAGIVGGMGFEEFACGADGTAQISQSRYDPDGRLHPGRMRVHLEVLTWEQDAVLASANARVRIPRH